MLNTLDDTHKVFDKVNDQRVLIESDCGNVHITSFSKQNDAKILENILLQKKFPYWKVSPNLFLRAIKKPGTFEGG